MFYNMTIKKILQIPKFLFQTLIHVAKVWEIIPPANNWKSQQCNIFFSTFQTEVLVIQSSPHTGKATHRIWRGQPTSTAVSLFFLLSKRLLLS